MAGNLADNAAFANVSATQGPFSLFGGQYGMTVHATWGGGSVTLNRLALDGVTWVTVQAATADAFNVVSLPRGTYQIAIVTATGVYVDVTPVVTSIN